MPDESNIITLYANESQEEQAARLHALAADPATCFFAQDDHDRDDLPDWPLPADAWVWSTGDRWLATVAGFHADDWWEGADPEDIAARPDPWFRPISNVPTTGRLEYAMRDGRVISTSVSEPERAAFRATVWVDLEATDELDAAEIAWDIARAIESDPRVTNVQVDAVH